MSRGRQSVKEEQQAAGRREEVTGRGQQAGGRWQAGSQEMGLVVVKDRTFKIEGFEP